MTHRRRIVAALLVWAILTSGFFVGLMFTSGHTSTQAQEQAITPVNTEPVPADAIRVCESCEEHDLQATIDAAPDGAVIVVDGGSWPPLTITRPLRLVGQNWPVIDAKAQGTGITIAASDVSIESFDVRNSGRSFDKEDSGIYFEGERTQVLNNRLTEILFGVNGATGHDSVIAGNYIEGQAGISEGLRGDGIKVWYSHRVQIHHNHVTKSRDLLVWYSNESRVYENLVTDSRYGFHFMNSDDGEASRNQMVNNSVGIYIMYGKRFAIRDNLLQNSRGPSGHGLGLKEVDGFEVIGNVIYNNRIGIYNDNSPFSMNAYGIFHHNLIAYNDSGIGVLPSARANIYYQNSFVENLEQVSVMGEGPLSEQNTWNQNGQGNYWSDYTGYDADGDGIGDVPFRSAAMSEQLRRSHPQLQLFRFSLAETAVDFAADAMPLFESASLLEDVHPLVRPVLPENAPDVWQEDTTVRTSIISITLIVGVAASMWWAIKPIRAASLTMEVA